MHRYEVSSLGSIMAGNTRRTSITTRERDSNYLLDREGFLMHAKSMYRAALCFIYRERDRLEIGEQPTVCFFLFIVLKENSLAIFFFIYFIDHHR